MERASVFPSSMASVSAFPSAAGSLPIATPTPPTTVAPSVVSTLFMYPTTSASPAPPAVQTEHPNLPVSIWQWMASAIRSKNAFIGAGTESI